MVSNNYACAYKEVIEVLKHTNREDIEKIPSYKILLYLKYMNKNYDFKIDETKPLQEQNISTEAKAILANLFKDYWASGYQRQRINAKEKYEIEKISEQKYMPNKLFKNNLKSKEEKQSINDNNTLIEYKDTFLKRILNRIKDLFRKK